MPVGSVVDPPGTYSTIGAADLEFYYHRPDMGGNKGLGVIEITPEPRKTGDCP